MHFSVGFVVAAMALSAASTPLDTRKGATVPLHRREGPKGADGVANGAWYKAHRGALTAKYDRSFANYQRNTGSVHPLATKRKAKRGTGSNDLTDDSAQLWYGEISVGTPAVTFKVDYDTGSSDLFLPGPSCSENCDGHTAYDPSKSSSASDVGKTFSLKYGDGSTVSGEQWTDIVTVSGLTADKQTLGAADTYSTGFGSANFPADGLMGMGFKSISDYNADPVFQSLVAAGQTDKGVFSFKLASSGSQLYLGGTDSSQYSGEFTYSKVTQEGYWQVDMDSISVGGSKAVGSGSGIIDTGTTLLVGDRGAVQSVISAINGAKAAPEATYGSGLYMAPCDSIPTVSVSFGGKSWDISPETFNLGKIEGDKSNCLLGVSDDPQDAGFWIVGDVFLQNVYTAFDVDNSQVGFAKLA